MKKSRKILIYFFVFILFSTFNPNISNFSNLNLVSFFYIKKIKSVNDNIIFNTEIYPKLNKFHGTNIFLLKKGRC